MIHNEGALEMDIEFELLTLAREHLRTTNQRTGYLPWKSWFKLFEENWHELSLSKEHIKELKTWFSLVVEQSFISDITENWEELIFHENNSIQIFTHGEIKTSHLQISSDDFQLSLECLSLRHHQEWNQMNPFCSFSANNHRYTLTLHSLSPYQKSKLFVRKGSKNKFTLDNYCPSEDLKETLVQYILNKKNIIICGATGSGKTSFLKSLLQNLPEHEHIIVLEDAHEIQLNHPHASYLLSSSREKNEHYDLKNFCSYTLRMRPDRIILGEMRSAEVVPFISAMNTGHGGLISTLHADSAPDALSRIALLFQLYSENQGLSYNLILSLVAQAIDYIIFIKDKNISEIIKVYGSTDGNSIYDYIFKEDALNE